MRITLDISRHTTLKCFRVIGIQIDSNIFCLTTLWSYKERYDSGVGLFRIQVGKFIEYEEKVGIKIEILGFSWDWFKALKEA